MSGSNRVQACDFGLGPDSDFKIRLFHNTMSLCMQGPARED